MIRGATPQEMQRMIARKLVVHAKYANQAELAAHQNNRNYQTDEDAESQSKSRSRSRCSSRRRRGGINNHNSQKAQNQRQRPQAPNQMTVG